MNDHNQICILNSLSPDLLARMTSRRTAMEWLGKISVGLCSVPIVIAALSRDAFGASLPGDVEDVLRFALTLEHLEAKFYSIAVSKGGLIPQRDFKVFQQIANNENEHVKLLVAATAEPFVGVDFDYTAQGRFPDVFTNYNTFLTIAQAFEDTGVRAYKGQATRLMEAGLILEIALRIHSVEARHASELRRIRGQKGWITGSNGGNMPAFFDPVYAGEGNTEQGAVNVASIGGVAPSAGSEAFDEPLSKNAVLAIVHPFIHKS